MSVSQNPATQEALNLNLCGCDSCPRKFHMVSEHLVRSAFLKAMKNGLETHGCPSIRRIVPELREYIPVVSQSTVKVSFSNSPSFTTANSYYAGVALPSEATVNSYLTSEAYSKGRKWVAPRPGGSAREDYNG